MRGGRATGGRFLDARKHPGRSRPLLEAQSQWCPFQHASGRTTGICRPRDPGLATRQGGLTSGMGSDRRLQSFSWALSLTPHHLAESKFCQTRPRQMATHWRSRGCGSLSCSRQMAIKFPCRQASCTARAEDAGGPRRPGTQGCSPRVSQGHLGLSLLLHPNFKSPCGHWLSAGSGPHSSRGGPRAGELWPPF